MMYSVKFATLDDLYDLVWLKEQYFKESNYRDMTFDQAKCFRFFADAIREPDTVVLIARNQNGYPAGYFMFSFDSPFMTEKIALFQYFYVHPDNRDGLCSQTLLAFGLELCDHAEAKKVYASSTAGFSDNGANERALNILLKRNGFSHVGSFLIRG